MENNNEPYRFKSKLVEGKTYFELTEEEKQMIRTQPTIKKEDKEYLAKTEITKETEKPAENESEEITEESKENEGIKIISAIGNKLTLADNREVIAKDGKFYSRGMIWYGN